MKPLLENIDKNKGRTSFVAFAIQKPKFDFFWHYHPEYELTLIVKGRGKRIIGDHHAFYESGDLVLIGPGLPHTWVSDSDIKVKSEAIVVQFTIDFIKRFDGLYELSAIHDLLKAAKQGISIKGKDIATVKEQLKMLPTKNGIEKMTSLLHILNALSTLKQEPLATLYYQPLKGSENEKRINKVCQYIQKHAQEPLNNQKAAALIHLTPSAFCKFFKRATGKTFSDYVNDIRIANICSELMDTDKQIAEIAYANGFESITYFNRVFIKKKKMSPSNYRKMILN
jgi:AraC-like DNA-binding protein